MARAIYKIINTVNGKFYIGSAIDTRRRFQQHKRLLIRGSHHCRHLQNAWNKYGKDVFTFNIIRIVLDSDSLEDIEDEWLKIHVGKKYCYNTGKSAIAPWRGAKGKGTPNYGKPMSEEQKKKISVAILERYEDPDYQPRVGQKHSDESRAKISTKVKKAVAEGRGGCFIPNDETRKKMSDALMGNKCATGAKRTDEQKDAVRERMTGNTNWLGRHHSDESRAKMGKRLIELSTGKEFAVMNDAVKFYGMPNLTQILRNIKAGHPIIRGKYVGLMFAYADSDIVYPAPN